LKQEAGRAIEAEEAGSSGSAAASSSLFERLRKTFDSHRRPLLFGITFLVLAVGTARNVSVGEAPPVPALAQEAAKAVEAKPIEAASIPDAEKAASLLEASSLTAEPVWSAPLAAGRFIVDPGTVGDIPAGTPAALRQAALSGDAAALYEIAAQAADGRGMAQDMVTAARFFERASQAGLPPAQERLAMLHEKGAGVPRDLKQAAFWYERAALGGNIRAMHNLATLLVSGATGKPDHPAALRWYGEAAEAGFRDSQFNMGLLLARGIGSKPDLPRAFHWFSLAAAQGDAEAVRKRDEVAGRLGAADLKAAKSALEQWRPRTIDAVANEPPAAARGQTAALDRTSGNKS
jgi:localization factor PodJL